MNPAIQLSPEDAHRAMLEAAPRTSAFTAQRGFDPAWRAELAAHLDRCLGIQPRRVAPDPRWGPEEPCAGGSLRRFTIAVEPGQRACGWLALPAGVVRPPVVICLQGHTSGAHISIGRPLHPGDEESIAGERDFALQAVARGFAALALEQRAFGARSDARVPAARNKGHGGCTHAALTALLLGRSLARERAWDVARAIDLLETVDGVDAGRIACMGNSGGGTVTWYAATQDPRIAALMPSCSVCPYAPSIGSIDHCADNYLPGALLHFDMPDLAGLIAPRPCVVVCGRDDPIFPLTAVSAGFARIAAIYQAAGAADACRLVVGDGGHRFYAAQGWAALRELTGW